MIDRELAEPTSSELSTDGRAIDGCAKCPLCGGYRTDVVYRGCRNRRSPSLSRFDVVRCEGCEVAFLVPMPAPTELERLYSQSYHSHARPAPRAAGIVAALKNVCLVPYRLRHGAEGGTLTPFGGGRVLDIGCGTGEYLASMAALGWRCAGIDVSGAAIEVARRRLASGTWIHGTPEGCGFPDGSFDVATLWHTLEHLPKPARVLERVGRWLVPGGRLVVAVPNLDSIEARIFGRRWIELDVPGHLFFFTRASLMSLLRRSGFEVERVRPQVHPSTVSESVGFLLDDFVGRAVTRERRWLYHLLYPFTGISYALGNWGCIEVTAVKRR